MNIMKCISFRTALFCLGILGILVVSAPAAELDAHLPADTTVYLQWSGRSLTFDGSKFGQMVLDPEVEKLVDFFRGMIAENVGNEKKQAIFKKAWSCLRVAWQHPAAMGVYDIQKKGASTVILIDLGEDKSAFEKEFQNLVELLPIPEGQQLTPVTVGESSYTLLPGPGKTELAYGYLGNLFFFTIGPDQAKALLERKPEASLQANPKYQERMKAVGGEDVQFALYVDIEAIKAQVRAMLPTPTSTSATQPAENPADRITRALGVDKALAVAGTIRVVDKGMYTKIRLFSPAPHQGLLMPLAGGALSDADLSGVPGDADLAVAINLSPKALYEEILRVTKEISPNVDMMIQAGVAAMEQNLEISLEKDILASLGDTWVYSVSPSQGGPLVGSMVSVEVTDPERLQAAIDMLEAKLLPVAPKTSTTLPRYQRPRPRPRIGIMTVGDTKIHYFRTPMTGMGMAFLPAWAIHENRLYVALWPQVIASALENTTEPLTKRPEYQALRKRFSPNASAMLYVNTPEIMKKLYPLQLVGGTVLMNAIASQSRTTQPIPLWPGSLQSVLRYLIPQMNVISHDAEGITFEGYGTCPSLLPASPVILGTGVAILLPSVNQARYRAKCAVSKTRMKGLGTALELYNQAEGGYPEDAALLVEKGYASSKNFISPLSGKSDPGVKNGKFLGPIDYVYIRPSQDSRGDILMMYENPENYQDGTTTVLYVAGHVASNISMPELKKLIEQAKAGQAEGSNF